MLQEPLKSTFCEQGKYKRKEMKAPAMNFRAMNALGETKYQIFVGNQIKMIHYILEGRVYRLR